MFRTWLRNNRLEGYDFSHRLFPPASDRAFWTNVTSPDLVSEGEKLLNYTWPVIRASQYREFFTTANRLPQETPHFQRRKALLNLFFAELAEYKGRFLPDICDGIFAICEESFWGISAHLLHLDAEHNIPSADEPYIDLFAGETAGLLSLIYHILYDALRSFCPGIEMRIAHELEKRIITPYLTHTDFGWMGYTRKPNNWNPWILSNIVTPFLVCDIDNEKRIAGLEKMFLEINHYYNRIPADGGCEEGGMYWILANGKLSEFCQHLYAATNGALNLFSDPLLRKTGMYGLSVFISGNQFCVFGDGQNIIAERTAPYTIYCFGKMLDEPKLCAMAASLHRAQKTPVPEMDRGTRPWPALYSLVYGKEMAQQPDFVPESCYVLPVIQNAFMRQGDWYFGIKGGSTIWSHSHLDIGNFVAYHQGNPVLMDVGAGLYTGKTFSKDRYSIWTMRSGWHNLPVFNGIEQAYGQQHCANGFDAGAHWASVSFAEAYPKEASILKALRTVSIAEGGITAEDQFVFERDRNTVSQHFISVLKPEVAEEGILLGGKYLLAMDVSFTARIEYMSFDGDPKLTGTWQTDGLYRTCLDFTCGRKAAVKITLKSRTE